MIDSAINVQKGICRLINVVLLVLESFVELNAYEMDAAAIGLMVSYWVCKGIFQQISADRISPTLLGRVI